MGSGILHHLDHKSVALCFRHNDKTPSQIRKDSLKRGESTMKEITKEQLDHMPDPIARMVWIRWIENGEARMINQKEVEECQQTAKAQ